MKNKPGDDSHSSRRTQNVGKSGSHAGSDNKESAGKKFSKAFRNVASDASQSRATQSDISEKEQILAGELERTKQDLLKTKNQLVRLASDYQLARSNKDKEIAESKDFAISKFVGDLIMPFENLLLIKSGLEAEKKDAVNDAVIKTLDMTIREFLKVFEKHYLVRIYPLGEKFNHDLHEAVSVLQDAEKEPGIIVEVLQAGYLLNNRLIKPATVVIIARGDS